MSSSGSVPVLREAIARPLGATRPVAGADWLLLAGTLAAALRFSALGRNSLWIDELASLHVARYPLSAIPEAALHGNAFEPPIYFLLLHGMVQWLGASELSLRLISAVAGVLTVPVFWLLVRELTGRTAPAAAAALLLAVSPLHLWYSQEARPYALALLFGAVSLAGLLVALRTGRRAAWATYAVAGACAVLTHLVSIVVPGVAAGWLLLDARRRRVWKPFAVATTGTLLLILPFLVALVASVQPGTTGSPPRPLTGLEAPYTLLTYVTGHSFGPSLRDLQDAGWRAAVAHHPLQTVLAVLALALILGLALRIRATGFRHLAMLLVLPLAAALLGSAVTTKAYAVRYTLPALLGLLGLAAVTFAGAPRRGGLPVLGGLIGLFLWADAQWFLRSEYWKEDSRAAVACLGRSLPPGATVAVAPRYMRSVVAHYAAVLGQDLAVVGIDGPDQLDGRVDALLVTRLHHVGDSATLLATYRTLGGSQASREPAGYRVLLGKAAGGAEVVCGTW